MSNKERGTSVERQVLHALEKYGFTVCRTAGSGLGGRPDLIAFRKGRIFCFEVKSGLSVLTDEQKRAEKSFCRKIGGEFHVVRRIDRKTYVDRLPFKKFVQKILEMQDGSTT